MRKLKSHLVALASSVALAFGTAAPAGAMTSDELAALLMMLGNGSSGIETSPPPQSYYLRRDDGYRGNGYWDDDDYRDRPFYLNGREERSQGWNHDRRRQAIPVQCVFPLRTKDGRRDVVSSRCLSNLGFDRRLPRDCAVDIRISGGRQLLYGAPCLERAGYRFAAYR